jgi:hypothetical protein
MKKVFTVFTLILLCNDPLFSQRFVDRHLIINPLMDTTIETGRRVSPIHSFGGWASFGRHVVRDHDHAFFAEMAGFSEIVRFGDRSNILATALIEVIMDPHNDINFNPRAIIWEEGLFFTRRFDQSFWKIGFVQRCKHDVDNLLINQERTLIFSSIRSSYIFPVNLSERSETLVSLRGDLFTILQDHRIPRAFEGTFPEMHRLIGTLGTTVSFNQELSQTLGIFANAYTSLHLHSNNRGYFDRFTSIRSIRPNAGIFTGLSIMGNARLRLGVRYEYLSDTGIPVEPRSSHLVSFGFMFFDPRFMR